MASIIISIAILFFAPCHAQAHEIRGSVKELYREVILLDVEGGRSEVFIRGDETKYVNIGPNIYEDSIGDMLTVRYDDEVAGVKLAKEVIAEPIVGMPESVLNITSDELADMEKGDYVLIDVRAAGLYNKGHLPNAISMTVGGVAEGVQRLTDNKEKTIIFYSESMRDAKAIEAAKKALSMGYKDVRVLLGGIKGWIRDKKYIIMPISYLKQMLDKDMPVVIIDSRQRQEADKGYIPQAVSIPHTELVSEQVLLPTMPDPIVFYGKDENDAAPKESAKKTAWWGYAGSGEAPVHVLEGGFNAWKTNGMPIQTSDIMTSIKYSPKKDSGIIGIEEFRMLWTQRDKDENRFFLIAMQGDDIPFSKSIPVKELPYRISEIPKDKEIIVFCSFGMRAIIAYNILKNNGYKVRYLNRNPHMFPDGTFNID